jgi:flagellar biosynthesis anti-sigma factor FlgM
MIISNQQVNSIIKAYNITATKKNPTILSAGSVQRGDSLLLSPEARELNKIRNKIDATPEIRSGLVQEIKTAIEKGEYQVSSEEVAHRMLVRSLVDHIMGG